MAQKNKKPDEREILRAQLLASGGDSCLSCGACVTGCPISDWSEERLDPRRAIRLIQYGVAAEVVQSDWIWQCTNCGRCSYTCPVGINIGGILEIARSLAPRDRDPGPAQIQKTANLHRTTSNNMAIEDDQWLDTVDWMREELEAEVPEIEVPIDKQGAEFYVTINSKLPKFYPLDLQHIFKIYHAAGVSWTLSSSWWEGTNYAMFTGDMATWEATLKKQVARVHQLGCTQMAYTECGHGYFATMRGLSRFSIAHEFEVNHVVALYARWIREGRFKLDPARNPQLITLHDPCNATRKSSMAGFYSVAEDARYVISQVCQNFQEMTPNRDANYCCSGGGGALLNGFKRARTHYGRTKVEQVDRTGAEQVCTPCVNCFDGIGNLARDFERPWEPVHLWTLLSRAIVL